TPSKSRLASAAARPSIHFGSSDGAGAGSSCEVALDSAASRAARPSETQVFGDMRALLRAAIVVVPVRSGQETPSRGSRRSPDPRPHACVALLLLDLHPARGRLLLVGRGEGVHGVMAGRRPSRIGTTRIPPGGARRRDGDSSGPRSPSDGDGHAPAIS